MPWRIAGWANRIQTVITPTTAKIKTGTSQLITRTGTRLSSANTSPGAATTLNNFAVSGIAGVCGGTACGSGIGGMGSMIIYRAYPLLRQNTGEVTRKVGK